MKHVAPFLALSLTFFSVDAVAQATTDSATPSTVVTADPPPEDRLPWIVSALGVAEDVTTLSAGIVFVAPYPTLDLRLLHGLTPRIAVDAHLATLGFTQAARVGARLQVMSRDNASLAVRAGVQEGHTTLDQGAVWIAAGPGVLASFGTDDVQVTASMDLGVMFHDSAAVAGSSPGVTMRPALGLEVPIDAGYSLLVESGGLVFATTSGLDVLPFFASGLAW